MNDIRRIAFVSERFFELQGLGAAIFGGALIFSTLLQHTVNGAARSDLAVQVLVFPVIVGGQSVVVLQTLYRRALGDVVAARGARFLAGLPMSLVHFGVVGDMLTSMAGSTRGPSWAAVALVIVSCRVLMRDWPWRRYHVASAAAGVAAVVITAAAPARLDSSGIDPRRGEAYLFAYALMGLGLVIGGLLDHRLLTASVHAPPAGQTQRSAAPRRRSLPFSFWLGLAGLASSGICLRLSDQMLGLALPMTVLLGPLAVGYVATLGQTSRAFRELGTRMVPDSGSPIGVTDDVLGALFIVGVGATIDSALFSAWSPALLALSIGLSSVWLTLRNWDHRKLDLVWAAAAAATLVAIPLVSSTRALVILIVSMSAALVIHSSVRALDLAVRSDHANTV